MLENIVRPELGKMKVADVRHADIDRLHRKVSERAPYRANRVAAVLSKMLSFAVKLEWREENPVKGLDRNPEERRYRYLAYDELRRLTEALATSFDFPNWLDTFAKLRGEREGVEWARNGVILRMSSRGRRLPCWRAAVGR